MVDEDEYEKIVERRRNEDDFVVDDSKTTSVKHMFDGLSVTTNYNSSRWAWVSRRWRGTSWCCRGYV